MRKQQKAKADNDGKLRSDKIVRTFSMKLIIQKKKISTKSINANSSTQYEATKYEIDKSKIEESKDYLFSNRQATNANTNNRLAQSSSRMNENEEIIEDIEKETIVEPKVQIKRMKSTLKERVIRDNFESILQNNEGKK